MNVGAQVGCAGIHYRVWAPGHSRLRVRIQRRQGAIRSALNLEPEPGGYLSRWDPDGRAGDRYVFELADGSILPDPASRFQPEGVHGPSECIDPRHYRWRCPAWRRPPWRSQVIYELHVGAFTASGAFRGAIDRLEHLQGLGVGAIELMPVADFPGERNWGYDGVALFAPARCYGRPDDLRALVDSAHERGLAVILDVVYNHTGPEGSPLSRLSPAYFHRRHSTPWGPAFNLDGEDSQAVREFFVGNAVYWLEEFRIDGLRLDATHAMRDESPRHLLADIAAAVHARGGFVIAEDERNDPTLVTPADQGGMGLDAAWSDDFHHQVQVALTGSRRSYFASYSGSAGETAQTLQHGWFYRGQAYPFWSGKPRGGDCRHLPTDACVLCIENHDQAGNRALGERLGHMTSAAGFRAASMLLCLCPYPLLLFMGQEWSASSPFLYFTDHSGDLGRKVSEGRRREFPEEGGGRAVPDPQDASTFLRSKLEWAELAEPGHAAVLSLYRACLRERAEWLSRATDRKCWEAGAIGQIIVLRYRPPDSPERLVLAALRPGASLPLWDRHLLLRPPPGQRWSLTLCSEAPALDFTRPAAALLTAVPA